MRSMLALVALGACSTTPLEEAWRAPNAAPLANVVALAAIRDGVLRRALEDGMAGQLVRRGVRAIPAYSMLADDDLHDRERALAVLRMAAFDGVIAMRFVAAKRAAVEPGLARYWSDAQAAIPPAPARVQIDAYSLERNQLVWSAISVDRDSIGELINDVTKVAGRELDEAHVVGAARPAAR